MSRIISLWHVWVRTASRSSEFPPRLRLELPDGRELVPDPRWKRINRAQLAEDAARAAGLSVAERLDRGLSLLRVAADLRRAAWEA